MSLWLLVSRKLATTRLDRACTDPSPEMPEMISAISASPTYPAVPVHRPFFAFETRREPVKVQPGPQQPGWAISKDRP
jgi:hypothetical protein